MFPMKPLGTNDFGVTPVGQFYLQSNNLRKCADSQL